MNAKEAFEKAAELCDALEEKGDKPTDRLIGYAQCAAAIRSFAATLPSDQVMVPRKPLEILNGMDQRHYARMPTYIKVAISELTATISAAQEQEADDGK